MEAYESDKSYWHGYTEFYEKFFIERQIKSIAEIGIYRGASVRWLLEKFDAKIEAADILAVQPSWPKHHRVNYTRLDQGNKLELERFFREKSFDLIIEDGSHDPAHQALALITGVKHLRPNGLYILEDAHTAYPRYEKSIIKKPFFKEPNVFTILMALKHLKSKGFSSEQLIETDIKGGPFTSVEIKAMYKTIKQIHLYKRTELPKRCFSCKGEDYDLGRLRCKCGQELFVPNDSMAFVIEVY